VAAVLGISANIGAEESHRHLTSSHRKVDLWRFLVRGEEDPTEQSHRTLLAKVLQDASNVAVGLDRAIAFRRTDTVIAMVIGQSNKIKADLNNVFQLFGPGQEGKPGG
jgi:hypothetical protein